MKVFLLLSVGLCLASTSCTTLTNRRDLYNPTEDTGSYNSLRPSKGSSGSTGQPDHGETNLPPPSR